MSSETGVSRVTAAAAAFVMTVGLLLVAGAARVGATTVSVATEAEYRDALTTLSADNSGPHQINITAGFTIAGSTDPTYTGTQPLTINGGGNTVDANGNSRFLNHDVSQALIINDLTVRNASTDGSGGAVAANRTVEVNNSVFTGNSADGTGGAIDATTLTATDSTFTQNRSGGPGGAINTSSGSIPADVTLTRCTFTGNVSNDGGAVNAGALARVIDSRFENNGDPDNSPFTEDGGAVRSRDANISGSTFVGNRAENGGAVYSGDTEITDSTFSGNTGTQSAGAVSGSALTVAGSTFVDNTTPDSFGDGGAIDAREIAATNSTFTRNLAGRQGGAVRASVGATLIHVTLASNSAPAGANVYVDDGTLTAFAVVLADPQGGGTNCAVTVTSSQGYNYSDDASCGFTDATDIQNGVDPQLRALGDFGGPTQTRPPETTSPLVDTIPTANCDATVTIDQRDLPRPADGNDDGTNGCDIGAVELQPQPPPPPPQQPPTGRGPVAARPTFTG